MGRGIDWAVTVKGRAAKWFPNRATLFMPVRGGLRPAARTRQTLQLPGKKAQRRQGNLADRSDPHVRRDTLGQKLRRAHDGYLRPRRMVLREKGLQEQRNGSQPSRP